MGFVDVDEASGAADVHTGIAVAFVDGNAVVPATTVDRNSGLRRSLLRCSYA